MKNILFIFYLVFPCILFSQTDFKVNGLILFNSYGTKKPDIGAKIYIRTIYKEEDWSRVGFFVRANLSKTMYSKLKRSEDEKWLKENNLFTDIEFEQFDQSTKQYIKSFIDDAKAIKYIVGSTGEIEMFIKEGLYEVLVVSNNTKGSTYTELLGKIGGFYLDTKESNRLDWTFYPNL